MKVTIKYSSNPTMRTMDEVLEFTPDEKLNHLNPNRELFYHHNGEDSNQFENQIYLMSELPTDEILKQDYDNSYIFTEEKPIKLYYINSEEKQNYVVNSEEKQIKKELHIHNEKNIGQVIETVKSIRPVTEQDKSLRETLVDRRELLSEFVQIINLNAEHIHINRRVEIAAKKFNPREIYLISVLPSDEILEEKYNKSYVFTKTAPVQLYYVDLERKPVKSELIIPDAANTDQNKRNISQIIEEIKAIRPIIDENKSLLETLKTKPKLLYKFKQIISTNKGHEHIKQAEESDGVKIYLHLENPKTAIQLTDGVEVYTGMTLNSVRVFIWDDTARDSYCNTLFNFFGVDSRNNGHVAMAIKPSQHVGYKLRLQLAENEHAVETILKETKHFEHPILFKLDNQQFALIGQSEMGVWRQINEFDRDKMVKLQFPAHQSESDAKLYIESKAITLESNKIPMEVYEEIKSRSGHIGQSEVTHISLYTDLKKLTCCNLLGPTDFVKYFRRTKNKQHGEDGDYHKKYERHADYVIQINGFSDKEIKNMLDYYLNYVAMGNKKWALLGDWCCSSRYQNCSSICYNILEAGDFRYQLPREERPCVEFKGCGTRNNLRLNSFVRELIKAGIIFGICCAIVKLVDDTAFGNKYNTTNEAEAAGLLLLVRIALLAVLKCVTGTFRQCVADSQTGLSPMNFKGILLRSATVARADSASNVKLVHTADTLKDVYVASSVTLS